MVYNIGMIGIWGWATLFQLLSIFGILADINVLVWMYGVPLGSFLVIGLYSLLNLFGSYTAYNNASVSGASQFVGILGNELFMVIAGHALTTSILLATKDSWWYAQKMHMGVEKAAEAEAAQETLIATLFTF